MAGVVYADVEGEVKNKPAKKCKCKGCARRTKAVSGFCWQHWDMAENKCKPRTLEEILEDWLKQPGTFITPHETKFIIDMRNAAKYGVGYGWMQQIIGWEWASKDKHALK